MTEAEAARPQRSTHRRIGLLTTTIVVLGTAAAVGWAAAVPIGGGVSGGQPAANSAHVRTARQLHLVRANLQQVRRDLSQLLATENDLLKGQLANLSMQSTQLPSIQIPQSSTAPAVSIAGAPPTHTTTGASGVRP